MSRREGPLLPLLPLPAAFAAPRGAARCTAVAARPAPACRASGRPQVRPRRLRACIAKALRLVWAPDAAGWASGQRGLRSGGSTRRAARRERTVVGCCNRDWAGGAELGCQAPGCHQQRCGRCRRHVRATQSFATFATDSQPRLTRPDKPTERIIAGWTLRVCIHGHKQPRRLLGGASIS